MVSVVSMIAREFHFRQVKSLLERFPVVAILGARQVGKITLASELVSSIGRSSVRFDLENPADLARLADPMLALEELRGVVVLDEVQRRPELSHAARARRPQATAR